MIDAAKTIKHPSRFLRSKPVRGVIGVGAGAGHAGLALSPVASSAVLRRSRSSLLATAGLRARARAEAMKYVGCAIEFEGGDSVVTLNNPFRSGRVAV